MALTATVAPATVPSSPRPGGLAPSPSAVPGRPASRPRRREAPRRRTKAGPVGVSHRAPARPDPARSTRARLTPRGVLACWLAAIAAVVVATFGFAHGMGSTTPVVAGAQSVTVQAGGSLWDVARQVNPDVDPRVTIAAIRQANGLGPAELVQPGTTLAVPVYAERR